MSMPKKNAKDTRVTVMRRYYAVGDIRTTSILTWAAAQYHSGCAIVYHYGLRLFAAASGALYRQTPRLS
jgi:hypothetical protein